MKHQNSLILVGLNEPPPQQELNHLLLASFLKKLPLVFTKVVPHDHPPKRNLQHKFDLISGSMLPNKPACKTNPKEKEKIKTHYGHKKKKKVKFKVGDLVWIYLRKEIFPSKIKSKLSRRNDGPFPIVEKVNDNAYKVELPGKYGVSSTFNVADLSPCYDEFEDLPSLRANFSHEGENVVSNDRGENLMK